jgi:hypothetical protein
VSREGKIGEEGKEAVDATDILAALNGNREAEARRRRGAVTCYLSASEGWEKASNLLGGAFAETGPWLKAAKEE